MTTSWYPVEEFCPHCEPEHGSPHRCAWSVYVADQRDGDGQPVALLVLPTDGAHVANEDAEWLRAVIRSALANCTHDNHRGAGYGHRYPCNSDGCEICPQIRRQ